MLGENFDDTRWIANVRRALELCQPVDEREFLERAAVLIPMHLHKAGGKSPIPFVRDAMRKSGVRRIGGEIYCEAASRRSVESLFSRMAKAYADGNTSLAGLIEAFPGEKTKTVESYRFRLRHGLDSGGRKNGRRPARKDATT